MRTWTGTAPDLNLDGWPDLVFSRNDFWSSEDYGNDAHVYWGGEEGFSEERRLALPNINADAHTSADLDADGWPDLVFANLASVRDDKDPTLWDVDSTIYWGSPEGFSAEATTSLDTFAATDVQAADLNHDGWLDLAFGNFNLTEFPADNPIFWGSPDGFSNENVSNLPNDWVCGVAVGVP